MKTAKLTRRISIALLPIMICAGCAGETTTGSASTRPSVLRAPEARAHAPQFESMSIMGVRDWYVSVSKNGSATFVFAADGGPEGTLSVPAGTFDMRALYRTLEPSLRDYDRTRPMAVVCIWRKGETIGISRYSHDFTTIRRVFLRALEFAKNKEFRRRFEEQPPFLTGPNDDGQVREN